MKRTLCFVFATTIVLLAALTVLISAAPQPALAQAPALDPAVVKEMAPTGTLRIGVYGLSTSMITKNATTGEWTGIFPDLAKELASRLGVPYTIVPADTVPAVSDLVKNGKADIGFDNTPAFWVPAAGVNVPDLSPLEFTAPILQTPVTVLVPQDSLIKTLADLQKPGIRIVVNGGGVAIIMLTREYKQAQIIPATGTTIFNDLQAGKADAVTNPLGSQLNFVAANPGYRILSEPLIANGTITGISVPKGRAASLAYLNAFVEDLKTSGLMQRIVDRSGQKGNHIVPSNAALRELAPTGTLRIGVYGQWTTMITKNATTGEWTGIFPDLAKELSARLGIPYTIVPTDTIAATADLVKNNQADIAFDNTPAFWVPAGASAPDLSALEYTAPYLQMPVTVLVPPNSSIQTLADLQKPGLRIVTNGGGVTDIFLTREYKQAQIIRATGTTIFNDLQAGKADAVANPLSGQLTFVAANPGYRILSEPLIASGTIVGISLPKGRAASLAYLSAFVEDIKSSGFVQGLIDQSGQKGVVVPSPAATFDKINHVIVIYQENWSFDGLLGKFPGANGIANAGDAATQVDKSGKPYATLPPPLDLSKQPPVPNPIFPNDLPNAPFDLSKYAPPDKIVGSPVHAFYQGQYQINNGKMNMFVAWTDIGGLVMSYYDATDMPLGKLAKQYTLADDFFPSAFGGSFLNHQWLVCACTPTWPNAPASRIALLDANGIMVKDGSVTPDGYVVNTSFTINTPHSATITDTAQLVPLQTAPTIGDRLSEKGITWTWYSGGWNDAIAGKPDARFQFHHQPFAYFANYADGTPGRAEHLKDEQDFLNALKTNTLPAVSFVKALGPDNEHPSYSTPARGQQHTADLVKAVQDSAYWKDTVIFYTYDENGGRWDHVAPPIIDRWGPGTRVPTVIISPFAKKGFVDHTQYETVSILKFIETRWGLAPLGTRDAAAKNFENAFDFSGR